MRKGDPANDRQKGEKRKNVFSYRNALEIKCVTLYQYLCRYLILNSTVITQSSFNNMYINNTYCLSDST
jgi:hypothetical protein